MASRRTHSPAPDSPYWDEQLETMSRDEITHLQLERLQALVRRCVDQSSFYREKLAEAGFEPGDLRSLDHFNALPVITKQELRDDQEHYPPFGRFVLGDSTTWRELHPSTGTTGRPVNTVWAESDVDSITDFTARTLWQFGVRPGDVIQNAFAYGLWVAGMSCHYAGRRIGCLVVPVGAATTTEKQIGFLLETRPTVLLSTPSYAIHIAERLRELGVDSEQLSLRLGCFGGEPGASNPATRQRIETRLGIDAFDYYGLAEIGPTFASECKAKAGLHFAEDHILVECLDPGKRTPVGDGEPGVLVFTTLTREATPVLRYWSNDVACLTTETCPCGRTHIRALGGIIGRQDDQVIFKGSKFYPLQVEKVVRGFGQLSDEFRIEIDRLPDSPIVRGCCVVVEPVGEALEGLGTRVAEALHAELGVRVDVRLERFGALPRTTFKANRLIIRETSADAAGT